VAPDTLTAHGDPGTPGAMSDVGDDRPGWNPEMGGPLVPGMLAWDRFTVGRRRETWLCWSVDLWAPVVVKLVRPGWRPSWTQALDREVRALAHVAHPAVPRLLADGRDGAVPYIAVEYFDGPSLSQCADAEGAFPCGDVARIGVLVLGAVRALHAAGNAHLDISPHNVLLADRRPRLIDLGASRPLGTRLEPGERLGTVGFRGPELADAPGVQVTPAMDVCSVGATLLQVLDRDTLGAGELVDRLAALIDPDSGRRPTTDAAMAALTRIAGSRTTRPWPGFAEQHLPRAPRRRRAPVGLLAGVPID
jgi:serine/threonine protein kinase